MKLQITGGVPLIGSVRIPGSRKAAGAILSAACYSPEVVEIANFPRWKFVEENKARWEGAGISWQEAGAEVVRFDPGNLHSSEFLNTSSVEEQGFLVGPLLYRFSRLQITNLAWEFWEREGINWANLLPDCGLLVNDLGEKKEIVCQSPVGFNYTLKRDSLLASQFLLILASLSPEESTINNLSFDPEVTNLEELLKALGVTVNRVSERKVVVQRGPVFQGGSVELMPDLDIQVFWTLTVLASSGELEIMDFRPGQLASLMRGVEKMGLSFEVKKDSLKLWRDSHKGVKPFRTELTPYPGLRPSWAPLLAAVGAGAHETTLLLTQQDAHAFNFNDIYLRLGFVSQIVSSADDDYQNYLQEILTAQGGKRFLDPASPSEILFLQPHSEFKKTRLTARHRLEALGEIILLLANPTTQVLELSSEVFESVVGIVEALKECGAKVEVSG